MRSLLAHTSATCVTRKDVDLGCKLIPSQKKLSSGEAQLVTNDYYHYDTDYHFSHANSHISAEKNNKKLLEKLIGQFVTIDYILIYFYYAIDHFSQANCQNLG